MNRRLREIDAAAKWVRRRAPAPPGIAVILGSGLGHALSLQDEVVFPFTRVPGFAGSGVAGHSGALALGRLGGRGVAVMRGRVHYYEGHDMDRVVFPVRALARAGARILVATNAVGSTRRDWAPGTLVLIRDHLNGMPANPLRGPNIDELGPRFPDMTEAYDRGLRDALKRAARAERIPLREGVYAASSGPTYETPAEVRAWRRLGADLLGMSLVPEAIAARHAGMRLAAVSCVTNPAAGLSNRALSHDEVIQVTAESGARLGRVLRRMITSL